MGRFLSFLKSTFVGGVLVLLPIAAVAYLVAETLGVATRVLAPIASRLPVGKIGGVSVAYLAAAVGLVLLCFAFGIAVRTVIAARLGRWIESALLGRIPGYRMFRTIASQLSGKPSGAFATPVWVRLDDTRQIGFLVEEAPPDEVIVFVPLSPILTVGAVHRVSRNRVERIASPLDDVASCVSRWGTGAGALARTPSRSDQ